MRYHHYGWMFARFEHGHIRALGDVDYEWLVFPLVNEIVIQAFPELADLDTDDVVLAGIVVCLTAEDAASNQVLAQLLGVVLERAFADVEQQFPLPGRAM